MMLQRPSSVWRWLLVLVFLLHSYDAKSQQPSKQLRVCIVEGSGNYKKGAQNCPTLEKKSNLRCVYGLDRLDCLRKVHKGNADFAAFSPEDLLAARWSGVDILVTSELRFHSEHFEYQIVVVVDNEAEINTARELRGSKFCHPGHGLKNHWTEVLADYFETRLTPRECEADLSPIESRLKSVSSFFGPSCRAGPWVPDPEEDRRLKMKYPSLCQLCYNSYQCGIGDKHWGRRGPLYCLTSGAGEVAWARLDDVQSHFGFGGLPAEANSSEYSFLCPDGHLQPLDTRKPCVWVSKPWAAIAARSKVAVDVQDLVAHLSHDDINSWQNALLMVLETYHVNVTTLDNVITVDDYLDQAVGFQDAYNNPGCNPSRSIVFCTKSLIELSKCSWLQEVATVYGVEPGLQCIRTESLDKCMAKVGSKDADVVIVDQDNALRAQRDYGLRPMLYEHSSNALHKYMIVAVVTKGIGLRSGYDLRNRKACFPHYEGAAHLAVMTSLRNHSIGDIRNFFTDGSCNWHRSGNCAAQYSGDEGAMRCLQDGVAEVAFVSYETFKAVKASNSSKAHDFTILCPFNRPVKNNALCYLGWTAMGRIMVNNETVSRREKEIYNALKDIDKLFGRKNGNKAEAFNLYGPFDGRNNVLFNDATENLRNRAEILRDKSDGFFEPSQASGQQMFNKKRAMLANGNGGLRMELITEAWFPQVIHHLRQTFFADEPLNKAVSLCRPGDGHTLLEKHSLSSLHDGISVMAVTNSGEIAGVVVNGVLHGNADTSHALEKLNETKDEKFRTIFTLLYEENLKIDLFEQFAVEKIFEIRILSVDSKFRGQGLAKELMRKSEEVARNHGFRIMKTDATGMFSQRVASSLGFSTAHEIKYDEYLDQQGCPVFHVAAPHDRLKIMYKALV
ncbi:transferrin [Anopheles darlingi]|uniref:transferrin n=1 Tax=Anopheles darlingi TaxID=43151 RepID=UPI002100433D|nr:transferrin [Anopheles darlingi]